MGQYIAYENHCKFRFGSCVESHEDCNINNGMEEQTGSVIFLGPTENFQGGYKILYLKTGQVVTRNQKIREIPMPTWVIQQVAARAMCDGWDLADGNEPMFINRFTNKNDFAAAPHEGVIAGVAQDDDDKEDDNDNDNSNTNEDPDDPTGIFIKTAVVLR